MNTVRVAEEAILLDAALEYASRGVPVFPVWGVVGGRCQCGNPVCMNPGKHPCGPLAPNGFKDATTNADCIHDWWTRVPNANIGTPTSWCVVLDVDPRHGGNETLAGLERQHGPLPETAAVLTGGGGRHVYFARPAPPVPSRNGVIGPGLDVKGDGGYVILPPSSHISGHVYIDEVEHPLFETTLAPFPPWLLACAIGPTNSPDGDGRPGEATDWAGLLEGAPEGQRHDVAVRVAGHYLGKGLPSSEVLQIMLGFAARCTPPFPAAEIRSIVADLARKDATKDTPTLTVVRDNRGAAAVAGSPEIRRDGEEFTFLWLEHGVGIGVNYLREGAYGLQAELTVHSSVLGDLHWGHLNLASTSAREGLIAKLLKVQPATPWRPMLETLCRHVAEQFREGEPLVELRPARGIFNRYLVDKVLPLGETAVIFGDGGAGKSLFALALAIAVSSGVALPQGLRALQKSPVLVLDWESCREEQEERLAGLAAGLGLPSVDGIHYRSMARALADDATQLRGEVSRRGIGLVIVDSLGPACGAEPESADSTIRAMNSLRSFAPATCLVIAHVSKAAAEQRMGSTRPFGSVYVQNLARSVWEVRRSEDEGGLVVGLFHRKVNRGRLLPPMGFCFEFDENIIRLWSHDIGEQPDLLARTSLAYRIRKALAEGTKTVEELSEFIDAPEASVARTLRRLKKADTVIWLGDAGGGRGREVRWGLKKADRFTQTEPAGGKLL